MNDTKDRGRAIVPGPWDVEEWRPIAGYEGYEISDWGRVRSYWKHSRGGRPGLTAAIIGGYVQHSGHRQVALYKPGSRKADRFQTAPLVLEAFAGPRPEGKWALHRNGNPADNRLENLYWGTPAENNRDTLQHGSHRQAKLTEADIPAIWARLVANESARSIARDYEVSDAAISGIRTGDRWDYITRHLPGWPLVLPDRHSREPIYILAEFCGPEEVWMPLPDWPAYRVSNKGRVQSCYERVKGGYRGEFRHSDNWTDKAIFEVKGYLVFTANKPGTMKQLKVHVAVLSAFACPKPDGMFGCHIDGDPFNNHASNLRWDTPRANALDRVRHRGR